MVCIFNCFLVVKIMTKSILTFWLTQISFFNERNCGITYKEKVDLNFEVEVVSSLLQKKTNYMLSTANMCGVCMVAESIDDIIMYNATWQVGYDFIVTYCLPYLEFSGWHSQFLILQKEIALYTASKINSEFCWFDIDGDIDPLFKVMFYENYNIFGSCSLHLWSVLPLPA